MKQALLIFIGVIIIGIGIWLTFFSNKNNSSVIIPQKKISPTSYMPLKANNTFPSIAPLHLPSQKCVMDDTTVNKKVVFTKETNIRVEFEQKINNLPITNILFTNSKLYTWDKNTRQGSQINVSDVQNNPLISGYINTFMKQLEQQKQNCQPIDISNSVFTVPEDINFKNIGKN